MSVGQDVCVQFTVLGDSIDTLVQKIDICTLMKNHNVNFVMFEFRSGVGSPTATIEQCNSPEASQVLDPADSFPVFKDMENIYHQIQESECFDPAELSEFDDLYSSIHSDRSARRYHANSIMPDNDNLIHPTCGFSHVLDELSIPLEQFSSGQCSNCATSYTADLLTSPNSMGVQLSIKLTECEEGEHIAANLIPTEESSGNNIDSEVPLIVAVVVEELLDNVCATITDLSLNCSDFQLNSTGLAECLGDDFLTAEDSAHSLQLREALALDVPITHNDTHAGYGTTINMDRADKDESYLGDGVPEVSFLAVPVYNNYTSLDQLDFALVPIMQNAGSLEKSDDDIDHKRNGRRGNQRNQDSLKLPKRLHCSFPGCSISLAVNRNSKSFRTSRLIRHSETHAFGDFPCSYCNFKGISIGSLRYHHSMKHPGLTFFGTGFTKEQYRFLLAKCFPDLLCDLAQQ